MANNAGYAVHHLESDKGQALLLCYKLTLEEMDKAVNLYNSGGDLKIRTVIGISNDGLIGSEKAGWHPNLPNAFAEVFVIAPWVQLLELLGRIPKNSTEALFDEAKVKQ